MRSIRRCLLGFFVLALAAAAPGQTWAVQSVETVGFTVADIDRSVEFFVHVLQFTKLSDETLATAPCTQVRRVRLKLGDELLELTQYPNERPFPRDARPNDRSFQHIAIIVRDMDKAYAVLRKNGVRHASSAPQTLPESIKPAAGIRAFYFRDPDGHYLEILQFPADKGAAKWHRAGNQLFMGIDHTAVVVGDTGQSLKFYRDLFGMEVKGESDNFGYEQEHLNGVFGAHLRITALRADRGPGVELLEYLSPLDGRPYPTDARNSDLLHWETRVAVPAGAATIAAEALSLRPMMNGEITISDPDGHVFLIHPTRGKKEQ